MFRLESEAIIRLSAYFLVSGKYFCDTGKRTVALRRL
jgi:hypothetical protein